MDFLNLSNQILTVGTYFNVLHDRFTLYFLIVIYEQFSNQKLSVTLISL